MGGDALREVELKQDQRYRLLASARRRLVIDILAETTEPVGLEELAEGVVTREDVAPSSDDAKERVAISLHHVHLPKLSDAGVLDYDPEKHRIEPVGRIEG